MIHDYSQLFSLFRKGIMKIIGNNVRTSQVGQAPIATFAPYSQLFSIILIIP